jgi:hypothetical protein
MAPEWELKSQFATSRIVTLAVINASRYYADQLVQVPRYRENAEEVEIVDYH